MTKAKYQVGDRINLQINGVMIPVKISGIMDDTNRTGWKYGFWLGINYMWSDIWFDEEYLDLHCEKL